MRQSLSLSITLFVALTSFRLSSAMNSSKSITSAVALSPDPEMREREIRAMKEQVSHLRATALATGCGCSECQEIAERDFRQADRLQRRLDALMEGGNGNL